MHATTRSTASIILQLKVAHTLITRYTARVRTLDTPGRRYQSTDRSCACCVAISSELKQRCLLLDNRVTQTDRVLRIQCNQDFSSLETRGARKEQTLQIANLSTPVLVENNTEFKAVCFAGCADASWNILGNRYERRQAG